jgi:hypothetical protein
MRLLRGLEVQLHLWHFFIRHFWESTEKIKFWNSISRTQEFDDKKGSEGIIDKSQVKLLWNEKTGINANECKSTKILNESSFAKRFDENENPQPHRSSKQQKICIQTPSFFWVEISDVLHGGGIDTVQSA